MCYDEILAAIETLEMTLDQLKALEEKLRMRRKEMANGQLGRKQEVLALLVTAGAKGLQIEEIAKALNISGKNVSSQLTYLRKSGVAIGTSSTGRKFLENWEGLSMAAGINQEGQLESDE